MKEIKMDKLMLRPDQVMVKLGSCNTIARCIKSEMPSIVLIKKENGYEKVIDIIMSWIIDLNDYLNISRKMNAGQIKQTSSMIVNDFYYMNIADINFVFTRVKKGYYGNLYESLDGMKIYLWFDQYATERAQTAFDNQLNKHSKIKEQRN